MTRRATLERHRRSLGEIREIMNSMKSLAYMETRKLSRFLDAQRAVVHSIEEAASDLLAFHPDILPAAAAVEPSVYLLIGSERGFCGDFNHKVVQALTERAQPDTTLLAVGRRLCTLLEEQGFAPVAIDGASVSEDVTPVLDRVAAELTAPRHARRAAAVGALFHETPDRIGARRLAPPFARLTAVPAGGSPPILNRPPSELLTELADHYLFAALHAMLYTSLMAENNRRVAHLESAVKHLDEQTDDLGRRCNALRQEEIIEEIEVILLSAADLDPTTGAGRGAHVPPR